MWSISCSVRMFDRDIMNTCRYWLVKCDFMLLHLQILKSWLTVLLLCTRAQRWRLCGSNAAVTVHGYVQPAVMLWCCWLTRAMQTCTTSSTVSSTSCHLPGTHNTHAAGFIFYFLFVLGVTTWILFLSISPSSLLILITLLTNAILNKRFSLS